MPLWLLSLPWKWIALGLAVAGVLLYVHHDGAVRERAKWEAVIAVQKIDAANLLASETAKVLAKERANAELNATLEKERTDADAKNIVASANLHDAMDKWMRLHPGCRPNSGSAPSPNTGASGAVEPAARGTEELPAGSGALIQSVTAAADTLAAYGRECHAFVTTLGR